MKKWSKKFLKMAERWVNLECEFRTTSVFSGKPAP
jgi:hypothetical protein